MSQVVSSWAQGTYVLTFSAAQRGNVQASRQDFRVLVDGRYVASFTPSGKSYQTYSTPAFNVSAGTHTVTFQGLDSAGGDNTVFIDSVKAVNRAPVADAGFSWVQQAAGKFTYRPAGSAWTFAGTAGISAAGSGFTAGNPAPPRGGQVAFVQSTGAISQTVNNWAAGTYALTFNAAQRGNHGTSREDFRILVDGVAVGTFTPSGTAYKGYATSAFTVAGGVHTITIQGLNSVGGDNTVFIDGLVVQARSITPATSPAAIADSGFEQVSVGAGQFKYAPTGSPWTFSPSAGISGNSSGFTFYDPAAPEGGQVAYLQKTGTISQAVTGWAAGTYVLTFKAAQRASEWVGQAEDFQVLVDGVVVGTFKPSNASFMTFTTKAFKLAAGNHTITFKGLNTAGGDNSVLIDNVAAYSTGDLVSV
jgi:cell surface hyaluronidase